MSRMPDQSDSAAQRETLIETKISAARTRLIIEKPFLGALVLRLPVIKADPSWCNTTATDARALYYNENYIEQLDLDQTQCALARPCTAPYPILRGASTVT